VGELALRSTLFGVGGWAVENALYERERGLYFSPIFNGVHVPLLPAYVAGGAAVTVLAPYLQARLPWFLRIPIYAVVLSGIEFVGCQVDRRLLNACSWDYSKQSCAQPEEGCVNLDHAVAWGALGFLAEGINWLVDDHSSVRVRRTVEARRRVGTSTATLEPSVQLRRPRHRPARVRHALAGRTTRLALRRRRAWQDDGHDDLPQVSREAGTRNR